MIYYYSDGSDVRSTIDATHPGIFRGLMGPGRSVVFAGDWGGFSGVAVSGTGRTCNVQCVDRDMRELTQGTERGRRLARAIMSIVSVSACDNDAGSEG